MGLYQVLCLNVMYISCLLGVVELLIVAPGIFLTFCLLLGLFYSYWVAVSSFDLRVCHVYLYLHFHVWLLVLAGLLYSEEEMKGSGSVKGKGVGYWEVKGGETVFGIYCIRE